jgi:hypothetical protein
LGISRLKRLVTEDLTRAFTPDEMKKFSWLIEPSINLNKLTGYSENLSIPRKEAAKQIVEYFFRTDRIAQLMDLIMYTAKNGFKGEGVVFNNLKTILFEMNECGYKYNSELGKFVFIEKENKRHDWGFLKEGTVNTFCFISIDICDNSKLFNIYETAVIRQTYNNFKNLVKSIIEKRDGRIWNREGDGGLCTFHIKDFVKDGVLSAIDILSAMPIFNATSNFISEDILIRIGINSGEAEYKNDIKMIDSDAIEKAKLVEKKHTLPMTISVTPNTYQYLDSTVKSHFNNEIINNENVYNLKFPLLGEK